MNRKIELALFDHEHDITHIYPPFYFDLGPLPQKIMHVTGSKGFEFDGVYQSSEVEYPRMKELGFDIDWIKADKHNHYDLVANIDLGLGQVNRAYREIEEQKKQSKARPKL